MARLFGLEVWIVVLLFLMGSRPGILAWDTSMEED